jgi:hypothetical protein
MPGAGVSAIGRSDRKRRPNSPAPADGSGPDLVPVALGTEKRAGWGAAAQPSGQEAARPASDQGSNATTHRQGSAQRPAQRPPGGLGHPAGQGQEHRQGDGDAHLHDHPDRQEVTIQQRLDCDAGLQPLQHLLHHIDRELEAGQLGARRPTDWPGSGRVLSSPARNRRHTVLASEARPSTTAAAIAAVQ